MLVLDLNSSSVVYDGIYLDKQGRSSLLLTHLHLVTVKDFAVERISLTPPAPRYFPP